ncbi:SdiA-regulated domain-containing protein [Pseudomonas sp. PA27(2017)]|uniref:SdiA-regulated domain-containing protein n=1 Tax=Pseudomonas sp. PA27(2017) TaxID=1932112 RepID=UPI000967ACEB|nr:SdiA-regulated domain-containing protein [Pseudomonas sp. PA27(2017)]OLU24250.1 DNA-binding protein [Pseudomonas sp. PA27(2017)]
MLSVAKRAFSRLPVLRPWMWLLFVVLFAAAYQVRALHLDDRLYYWLTTPAVSQWAPGSLLGRDYKVQVDAKAVGGVKNNLSGLSYDEQRDQLWAVLNNPEELLAMSKDGEVLARYPLSGFSDVEGVTYLGDGLLLLAEEREHGLVVVPVPERAGALFREDYRALTLGIQRDGNQGFEGVGYDRARDRLFVAKEHSPMKLYEIRGLKSSVKGDFGLEIIDHEDWIRDSVFATDLSSVHFDERTGHLALLSDESKRIMELDGDSGKLIGFRTLNSDFAGLGKAVPQGEGMTFDDDGNLYIVSEPNLFYRFGRG